MKPFGRAEYGPDLTPENLVLKFGIPLEQAQEQVTLMRECEVWKNDEYEVAIRRQRCDDPGQPDLIHLSIKHLDKIAVHDWRKLQEIKNALIGPEIEAVELYPAESRLVDTANQYHLWAFNDPTWRWPFGFGTRSVSDASVGGAKQRPREVENEQ